MTKALRFGPQWDRRCCSQWLHHTKITRKFHVSLKFVKSRAMCEDVIIIIFAFSMIFFDFISTNP